jgi:CBS domain-containing protein
MPEKRIEDILKEKTIGEIVNPKCVQASPELPVSEALKLMQQNKSGYIVVQKGRKVTGLFTETDFVQKVLEQKVDPSRPISDFMNVKPAVLTLTDTIGSAIDQMSEERVYYIPLVNEKKELVNVISVRTLIRFLAAFYPAEVYNLPPRPDQVSLAPEGG